MKESIWLNNYKEENIKILNQDIETDILIIGGGMTGLTTAYCLIDSNKKITLLEQDLVGHGISSKTTGKLNYLQETIYSNLENTFSINTAKLYLHSQRDAIRKVKEIIDKHHIECNFNWVESYIFTNKLNEVEHIKKEKRLLEHFGVNVKEHNNIDINLDSRYAISVDNTAVFHPIKYLLALKDVCLNNNIDIYEGTKILKLKKDNDTYIAYTDKYKVKAKKVVVSTHYPFFILPFFMPLKTYIEKSYIIASKVDKNENKTYITSSLPCKSVRYHYDLKNNYMLYVSNSHKICNNINEERNFNKAIKEAKQLDLKVEYIWSNDDLITADKLPFIGKINNEQIYIGTGYNTWGMTNGTIAGVILSDLLLDKENIYTELFDPNRDFNLAKAKQYPINIINNISGFCKSKINKNKKWYQKNIKFTKIDGKNVAIYKDECGKHIVYNKCPHMGCSLIFNNVEKTWDCPCHASRFDINGKCIKGPSNYDISYQKNV